MILRTFVDESVLAGLIILALRNSPGSVEEHLEIVRCTAQHTEASETQMKNQGSTIIP